MALTDNKIVNLKQSPQRILRNIVSGTIHIYKGALLNYKAGDIGYVKLGSDTVSEQFAGIAMEEQNLVSSVNTADGLFQVLTIGKGSGELVLLNFTDTLTIANEGAACYVNGDDVVKLSVVNTTGGYVGHIREFVSASQAYVQMEQSIAP